MLGKTALEFQNSLTARLFYSSLPHYKISVTITITKDKQFNIRKNSNHLYNEVKHQLPYRTPHTSVMIMLQVCVQQVKGKGKACPKEARTGSEGSRKLRLPEFKTIRT